MYKLGITDKLWLLLYDWFIDSTCTVLLNGYLSEEFSITRSIKQGGVLSMYMFCIYFNDIHRFVDETQQLGLKYNEVYIGSPAFADDILLLSNSKSKLDSMMQNVLSYSSMWKLNFSRTKSKCMVFGETKNENIRNMKNRLFHFGDTVLEEVSTYTPVGISLCSYMSSVERTKHMCNKAWKLMAQMTQIGVRDSGFLPTVSLSLWRKLVLPSILHGCELWFNLTKTEIAMLEKTQCKILKLIQGFPKRTHNEVVRGMIGQNSILSCINERKMSFLQRLVVQNVNELSKIVFVTQLYNCLLGTIKNTQSGYTAEIIEITKIYNVHTYLMRYATGGMFPNKKTWKCIVKEHIAEQDFTSNIDRLLKKNDVKRYVRIYNGQHHLFYDIMTRYPQCKKELMAMVKVFVIPETYQTIAHCRMCMKRYEDPVQHAIVECTAQNVYRDILWDKIIGFLDVTSSVNLFNRDDDDFVDILFGKQWDELETHQQHLFYCNIAGAIQPLVKTVPKNVNWFRC